MKTLSLYIDRWYIAAAVCVGNIPRRIILPNREDRIWLYFYEDVYNNRIIYGKNYQQKYLDNELHYIGDIFSKIVKEDETFTRFDREVQIREIFEASDILDNLKVDFSPGEELVTYVSFSADVSYAAQKVFLDILAEEGFVVKESVAHITHLALELSSRRGKLQNVNNVLVVTACNENLRCVVYKHTNSVFVRKAKEMLLPGHGTDLRGRALLEQILSQVNSSTGLVRKEDEEFEIMRLSQNLERWLLQMDNTKQGRPVVYNDISFSTAPHNKYSATIVKSQIEERTANIVSVVVDEIFRYVKDLGLMACDISHIVFIGNSFRNSMFREALLLKCPVGNDKIMTYQDSELPEIVGVYDQIDLSQFDSLRADVEQLSAEQLEQIRQAEEERRERENANRRKEEIEKEKELAREADRKFRDAIEAAENYEKKADYSAMIDILNIALTFKPNDSEALQMLEDAKRLFSEAKVMNEQYNRIIKLAQEAYNEKRWQDAYNKSERALELRPESTEAKKIYTESQTNIKLAESVKEFLLRADTFIGQKLYEQALEELNKAKLADANNTEITERINRIEAIQNKQKDEISILETQLQTAIAQKNFANALDLCNKLLELDSANQKKWSKCLSDLNSQWLQEQREAQRLNELIQQIKAAEASENWHEVKSLCNQALDIKPNDAVSRVMNKAAAKIAIEQEKVKCDEMVALIKTKIADKLYLEARNLTNDLRSQYPEYNDVAKQLFKMIFDAQERDEVSKKAAPAPAPTQPAQPKRNPIGFQQQSRIPDFFDDESTVKRGSKPIENVKVEDHGSRPVRQNQTSSSSPGSDNIVSLKDFDF